MFIPHGGYVALGAQFVAAQKLISIVYVSCNLVSSRPSEPNEQRTDSGKSTRKRRVEIAVGKRFHG